MIFVTGGTGLVGSHLLFELTSAGKKVKALKRQTSNLEQVLKTFSYYSENAQQLFDQIEWVDGDILDYFSLEKILNGVKCQLDELKQNYQPKEPEEYLGRQQVADILHIDLSSVHNWRKKGVLTAYQIGGRVLFKRSQIEAAIVELKISKKC